MPDTSAFADPLELELVALGRSLAIAPPSDDLAQSVLARLAASEPSRALDVPVRPVARARLSRRRLAAGLAAAVLLVVALVPPVRAAVLDFFRIGGVTVEQVPTPSTVTPSTAASSSASALPSATRSPGDLIVSTLAEARARTGLDVWVPAALGAPTTVAITHEGRVVELTWGADAGSTRLDVFDGSLSWGFLKRAWSGVTPTKVGSHEAVWLADSHLIEWIDRSGVAVEAAPRVAGPTLVWVDSGSSGRELTYRLEGPTTLESALALATTAH